MGWPGRPRVLGIPHFPRVSLNTPATVYVGKVVNFIVPAVDVDALFSVIGNRPKTSRASDLGGARHSISIYYNMCQYMGGRKVFIFLKKLFPFASQAVFSKP